MDIECADEAKAMRPADNHTKFGRRPGCCRAGIAIVSHCSDGGGAQRTGPGPVESASDQGTWEGGGCSRTEGVEKPPRRALMARQSGANGPINSANKAADEGAKLGERTVDAAATAAASGFRSVSEAAAQTAGQARRGMEQLSAQGEAAARRSQQSVAAAADAGGVMMQGAQEISQVWMDLAQARLQHMAEGMRALAACRTPADLIKAQSQLLQEAMEQMADTNRRVTDVSMRVMQEVSGKVSGPLRGEPL